MTGRNFYLDDEYLWEVDPQLHMERIYESKKHHRESRDPIPVSQLLTLRRNFIRNPDDQYYNPTLFSLLRAIEKSESLLIIYDGGTTPGLVRDITPREVVKLKERGLYVEAYCHTRKEDRIFKLEIISLPDD